jgi:hypothetical protein
LSKGIVDWSSKLNSCKSIKETPSNISFLEKFKKPKTTRPPMYLQAYEKERWLG